MVHNLVKNRLMRSEIIAAASIQITVSWDVISCYLVGKSIIWEEHVPSSSR